MLDDDDDWQGGLEATDDAAGEPGSSILIARIEDGADRAPGEG